MRDQIYDHEYQAGRADLNRGIDRLVSNLAHGFERLTAIQFAAPWRSEAAKSSGARGAGRHVALILVGVALASGASVATALVPFAIA